MRWWVGLLVVAAFASAGCSSSSKPSGSGTTAPTSSPSTGGGGGSSSTVSSTTNPAKSRPVNVDKTKAVRDQLTAAFAAGRHLNPAYVAGPVLGTIHYAYDPATRTYWALTDFAASNAATEAHQRLSGTPDDPYIQFQDGPMVLAHVVGSSWKLVTDTGGLVCPPTPPAAILALWNIGVTDCH